MANRREIPEDVFDELVDRFNHMTFKCPFCENDEFEIFKHYVYSYVGKYREPLVQIACLKCGFVSSHRLKLLLDNDVQLKRKISRNER